MNFARIDVISMVSVIVGALIGATALLLARHRDTRLRSGSRGLTIAVCFCAGAFAAVSASAPAPVNAFALGALSAAGSVTALLCRTADIASISDAVSYLRRSAVSLVIAVTGGLGFAVAGFVIVWAVVSTVTDVL